MIDESNTQIFIFENATSSLLKYFFTACNEGFSQNRKIYYFRLTALSLINFNFSWAFLYTQSKKRFISKHVKYNYAQISA